jgi:dihydroorotase
MRPTRQGRARREGVFAVKLYPAHARPIRRTASPIDRVMPVLERMAARHAALIHGEVTDPEIDIFDREAVFIERVSTRRAAACGVAHRARTRHDR